MTLFSPSIDERTDYMSPEEADLLFRELKRDQIMLQAFLSTHPEIELTDIAISVRRSGLYEMLYIVDGHTRAYTREDFMNTLRPEERTAYR